MKTNPWAAIEKPNGPIANAKRVDGSHPFDFFWGLDLDGHQLLIFEYDEVYALSERKPRLNGISVIDYRPESTGRFRMILSLRQAEHREIFYLLCNDIVDATIACKDPGSALQVMMRRTWRWHQLLRGERDGRLSPEAQKGLIGELDFLVTSLLPHFSASEVLNFWEGPSGSPKDFVIGSRCVEVKARRGAARPFLSISSEHQLDIGEFYALYLYVVDLSACSDNDPEGFTLNDAVDKAFSLFCEKDPGSVSILESKLLEVGYLKEDDYSDKSWIKLGVIGYAVTDDFPKIVDTQLPAGIEDVKYKIDLSSITKYMVPITDILVEVQKGNAELR